MLQKKSENGAVYIFFRFSDPFWKVVPNKVKLN